VEVGDPVPVAGQRNSGLGHFVGLERKKNDLVIHHEGYLHMHTKHEFCVVRHK
jgi:hypothetical protein